MDLARRTAAEPIELTQAVNSSRSAAVASYVKPASTGGLILIIGLAAGSWIFSVHQMNGMDMGPATRLDSFSSFAVLWIAMMAAMMLPGATPAVLRRSNTGVWVRTVPQFIGSYLAVWAVVGVSAYALYRTHGSTGAGLITVAAGMYELTPVKRHFRQRSREEDLSGIHFGICCVGSSVGLMAMLLGLGAMSVAWMSIVALIACVQKLVPANAALDLPVALAIIGLGLLILIAPSSVPGLLTAM